VGQRRLSLGRLPRLLNSPGRFAACGLALLIASFPALAVAWPTGGHGHDTGWILEPAAPVIQTNRSQGFHHEMRLAEKWETESSVRYGSGTGIGESERLRREEKDQEERSWQMLENLSIEPHVTRKSVRPKPPTAINSKRESQTAP
jgi:hypothetical protein